MTNVQTAGVDEGGIVIFPLLGDELVEGRQRRRIGFAPLRHARRPAHALFD